MKEGEDKARAATAGDCECDAHAETHAKDEDDGVYQQRPDIVAMDEEHCRE